MWAALRRNSRVRAQLVHDRGASLALDVVLRVDLEDLQRRRRVDAVLALELELNLLEVLVRVLMEMRRVVRHVREWAVLLEHAVDPYLHLAAGRSVDTVAHSDGEVLLRAVVEHDAALARVSRGRKVGGEDLVPHVVDLVAEEPAEVVVVGDRQGVVLLLDLVEAAVRDTLALEVGAALAGKLGGLAPVEVAVLALGDNAGLALEVVLRVDLVDLEVRVRAEARPCRTG